MLDLSAFHGPNAGYVYDLYERYRRDPSSVSPEDRELLERWSPPPSAPNVPSRPTEGDGISASTAIRVVELANAIRLRGHLVADLDPLGRPRLPEPSLSFEAHGLAEEQLAHLPASLIGARSLDGAANALEAIEALRKTYCSRIGFEFAHVADPDAWQWLRDAVESRLYVTSFDPEEQKTLLRRLTRVEAFEQFLHRTFHGQTRFSIEGVDMLVPMLDYLVEDAVEAGICEVFLGMAHRGRLNVLAHVLGKPYATILGEFGGALDRSDSDLSMPDVGFPGWTGDVRYHLGRRDKVIDGQIVRLLLRLAPNPSHLEFVCPVLEGMARAADDDRSHGGPARTYENAVLPILIHGDAAFTGEGIAAETLNLSRLPGYRTGGTVHIIVNNQLGFTTDPESARSTRYASDPAKGYEIPIAHVNADDPLACVATVRLAFAYRQKFHGDFMIDLVGYRRWGHNEGDEPAFTQPLMYQAIASHPTVRQIWLADLEARGVVTEEIAERERREAIEVPRTIWNGLANSDGNGTEGSLNLEFEDDAEPGEPDIGAAVATEKLREIGEHLERLPSGFSVDPKLDRLLRRRSRALAEGGPIDWGQAETLAFASILSDGTPIRLTGQDVTRGTFGHRHVVVHDRVTGASYCPLQTIPGVEASFDAWDSPLSEAAALGFEYGYSVMAKDALTIWEAQYGDFVDAAQVIVDRFLVSGKLKWGQTSSLVLLLPHGHEGQGPDHSSALLERFLQMAANRNVVIAAPSTAGQYFHLLRRQAALLRQGTVPLVILTPKSLLRDPRAAADLNTLTEGSFQRIIVDGTRHEDRSDVSRLILCSGKVYHELRASESFPPTIAVARVEQLYPLPIADLAETVASYDSLQEIVWLQEEPENMGAWRFVEPAIRGVAPSHAAIRYVGRPPMASPAEGSITWHRAEQSRILGDALAVARPERQPARTR